MKRMLTGILSALLLGTALLTGCARQAAAPGPDAQEEKTSTAAPEAAAPSAAETTPGTVEAPAAAETTPASSASATTSDQTRTAGIDAEAAKAAALSHAGLTEDDVTFVQARLDYENGRQVYEVEFYTADYREYDYEIDAATGEVVSFDYDAEGYAPPASGGDAVMTAEDAKALALAQVPGAAESDIREFETDRDGGRVKYEGEIRYDGMEYEFEIDAATGEILSWEAEPAGR